MSRKNRVKLNFAEIWERIKSQTEIQTMNNLAELLEITQPSVSYQKTRGDFPIEWAYVVGKKYGLSLDWILTGEGEARTNSEKKLEKDWSKSNNEKSIKNRYISLLAEWLNEVANEDPRKEFWFQCNIERTFPEFKTWMERKSPVSKHERMDEAMV